MIVVGLEHIDLHYVDVCRSMISVWASDRYRFDAEDIPVLLQYSLFAWLVVSCAYFLHILVYISRPVLYPSVYIFFSICARISACSFNPCIHLPVYLSVCLPVGSFQLCFCLYECLSPSEHQSFDIRV